MAKKRKKTRRKPKSPNPAQKRIGGEQLSGDAIIVWRRGKKIKLGKKKPK